MPTERLWQCRMASPVKYPIGVWLLVLLSSTVVVAGDRFDIDHATEAFESALKVRENLSLVDYLEGFRELRKFLADLGILFRLVDSEIENKVSSLDELIKNPSENAAKCSAYKSVRSAIEFEVERNLVYNFRRPTVSRILSRLQWALGFMSDFMKELAQMDAHEDASYAARRVYERLLAKHHSWAVRMVISLALRTLPHKAGLVESVLGRDHGLSQDVIDEKIGKLAQVSGQLWEAVERIYEDNKLTDLFMIFD